MDAATVARWRTLSLILLGAFLGMSAIVYGVRLLPGEADLQQEIIGYRGTPIHAVARWLNYGGRWHFLAPAMLLLLACSPVARRRWWLWCGLLPFSGGIEQLFKFLVGRPRPRGINWGFPSGHVTAATTFAVLLVYVLSRERVSPAARVPLLLLGVLLVGSVGFARVILNAHWPSDVLGGILLGAGCAAAGAWWDATHPPENAPRPRGVNDAVRIGG
ncbi:MAG TPA: phosphatase PAP2 family protein [Candidatus Deferrimicrobiaceae bacterium]|nr:phosphatase PAP2 family protein [Candidatus Deferrimicrobiaceae bacterium]